MAGGAGCTISIWDITGSDPHLIKTLIGHTYDITSLIFPSYIISASSDQTVKFWETGTPPADQGITCTISTPPTPSSIESVSLQVRDGVAISSDSSGVVKTWDIFTGCHKASFQTPARGTTWRDTQLVEGRLIVAWCKDPKISIWDAEKRDFLQTMDIGYYKARGVRISGDGSKVFCLIRRSIQAWSIWTGEVVGKVELEGDPYLDPLYTDHSRIWVCFKDSITQGWDFVIPGSSPILLSNTSPDRPHLNFIGGTRWDTGPSVIKDTVTGKEVFQLVGRYAKPTDMQWDGQYLVAGYMSGEVLILDFNCVLLQ